MSFDWSFALDILPEMLYAFLRFSLVATVLGILVAAVLGLVFAIIRRAHVPVLAPITTAFIEFVRSTPLLFQQIFLFFVLPEIWITLPALTTGVIGLGVPYACYLAEVYRAGIESVPKGQWEAASALSLPPRLQWQLVILPQAIRNVLPALGNYAISMFKETPFLALITVPEMVQRAQAIGSISFRYLEPITLAGLIFLAASYPTAIALRKLEIRLGH
jgi:polar amino acid transport system permease protein